MSNCRQPPPSGSRWWDWARSPATSTCPRCWPMDGSRWPPRSAPTPAGSRALAISLRLEARCSNAVRRSTRCALCTPPQVRHALAARGDRRRAARAAREAAGGDAGGGRGAEVRGPLARHDRVRRLALALRAGRRSGPRVAGRPRRRAVSRSSGAKTSASGTRARRGSGSPAAWACSIRASTPCRSPPPSCRVRSSSQPRRWSLPREPRGADRRRARSARRWRRADHDRISTCCQTGPQTWDIRVETDQGGSCWRGAAPACMLPSTAAPSTSRIGRVPGALRAGSTR